MWIIDRNTIRYGCSIIIMNCVFLCSCTNHQRLINICSRITWTPFMNLQFHQLCHDDHFAKVTLVWHRLLVAAVSGVNLTRNMSDHLLPCFSNWTDCTAWFNLCQTWANVLQSPAVRSSHPKLAFRHILRYVCGNVFGWTWSIAYQEHPAFICRTSRDVSVDS